MIIQRILEFFFAFGSWLLQLLPDITFSPGDFYEVGALLGKVACIVPSNTVITCMLIWLAFANIDIFISIVNWVIRKIPGIS